MVKLTMLNAMAGGDFPAQLDQHVAWGLDLLDLKDGIWGKSLIDLTDDEVRRAADEISKRNLKVFCFSSTLFHKDVELGETAFREQDLAKVTRLIELARILQPQVIRLLSPATQRRSELRNTIPYMLAEHPWVISIFREAIDLCADAGFQVTIENEVGNSIFGTPDEVTAFFAALDRTGKAAFTWDVQNMWQVATYPSLDSYEQLKSLIDYFHLKGGQHDETSNQLRWRTALEDSNWPVLEITRRVVADGISPVICLNPPHGGAKEGYDYNNLVKRDIDFLRAHVPGVE